MDEGAQAGPGRDQPGERAVGRAPPESGIDFADRLVAPGSTPSAGRPLGPAIRGFFEPRLGWDFGDVRVHTDPEAEREAIVAGARAFTIGQSIAFAPGEYRPDTLAGRRLLAHELTHVVQQGTGVVPRIVQSQAAVSADWHSIATRMSLRDLDQAVLRLRSELSHEVESSAESQSRAEQLLVFEQALAVRQAPSIAVAEAASAARLSVVQALTTTGDPALRGAQVMVLLDTSANALFVQGFFAGCAASIPPGNIQDFRTELEEHWGIFYGGYVVGLPVGLWHGLLGLIEGLALIAKLAYWMSPTGLAVAGAREAYRFAMDPEGYLAARRADYQQASRLAQALRAFQAELAADPTVVLQWSAELGRAVGEETGDLLTAGFLRRSPFEKGEFVGDMTGQILFEVLAEVVLAAVTAGVGNALRAAIAGGQSARAGGRLAQILRRMLEASPAFRRLLAAIAGHSGAAGAAAQTGLRSIEVAEEAAQGARTLGRTAEVAEETAQGARTLGRTAEAVEETAQGARTAERTAEISTEGARTVERVSQPRSRTPVPEEMSSRHRQPDEPTQQALQPDDAAVAARRATNARRTRGLGQDLTAEQVDYLEDLLADLDSRDLDFAEAGLNQEELRRALAGGTEDEVWEALLSADRQVEIHLAGREPQLLRQGYDPLLEPEGLSPLDRPAGSPPVEGPVIGQIAEAIHPREVVGADPRRATEVVSSLAMRERRERLLRGETTLTEFAQVFPPEGVRQVRMPTPFGWRIVDHMYLDAGHVVLRESKNLSVFRLTDEYLLQLDKDLSLLHRFPDARVEWRIDGSVDAEALDHLNDLVSDYPRFSYRLDRPGPYSFVNGRYVVPARAPDVIRRARPAGGTAAGSLTESRHAANLAVPGRRH